MPAFQLILPPPLRLESDSPVLHLSDWSPESPGPPQAHRGSTLWGLAWPQRPNNTVSSLLLLQVGPLPPSPVCMFLDLSILIPTKLAPSFANPIYLFSIPRFLSKTARCGRKTSFYSASVLERLYALKGTNSEDMVK